MNKSFLIGSIAVIGLFVALLFMAPVLAHSGFSQMMGNSYNGQNWDQSDCPFFNGRGTFNGDNNGGGMMNWNGNGNYGGMMGN